MNGSRRDFLKLGFGGLGVVCLGGSVPLFVPRFALAEQAGGTPVGNDNILVVVQLSGGNDGLNCVVPTRDDLYFKARPQLALREKLHGLSDDYALNPGMGGFKSLWDEGQLSVVHACGYPKPNRSHFESMAIWHTADPAGLRDGTGWLGHTLDHLRRGTTADNAAGSGDHGTDDHGHDPAHDPADENPLLGVNIGDELPQALVTPGAPVPSIRTVGDFQFRTDDGTRFDSDLEMEIVRELNRPEAFAADPNPAARFLARQTVAALASADQVKRLTGGYTADAEYRNGFAEQLKTIAQLIDGGLGTRVFYCQQGGYDTHSNQPQGHETQLKEVSDGVAAFLKDLKAKGHADRVTVMVFSEFGRRVAQNASNGTDHGTAGPMFLAGAKVKAGFHGTPASLAEGDLDNGDLSFTTDFRRVYADVLKTWLNVDPASVLGEPFEPIGVL